MKDIRSLRILYIDDMSTIRTILKKAFSDNKFTDVEGAEDGQVALLKIEAAALSAKPFQIILCDWHMPHLNGLDLVSILRRHSNPLIRDVRFVMITGANDKIRQALDSGVDNYIAKPFTTEKLIEKIQFVVRHDPEKIAA